MAQLIGWMRRVSISCLFLSLALLAAPANLAAQTSWNDFSRRGDEDQQRRQYTWEVQTQLDYMRCYPPGSNGNVDRSWGTNSQAALQNFNRRIGGPNRYPAGTLNSAVAFLDFLKTWPEGYCGGAQVANPQSAGSRTCRKDDVGQDYLKKLAARYERARQLEGPLKFIIDNYDAIFPPGGTPEPEVADETARIRLEKFGAKGISRDTTRKALELVKTRFISLAFKYGFRDGGPCQVCYAVNDWKFLMNYAQSSGGSLFHSESPAMRISVAELTTTMMYAIKDNVLIFRRMTEKWLAVVEEGDGVFYIDADNGDKIPVDRSELEEERRLEMNRLIRRLYDIRDGTVTIAPTKDQLFPGRRMSTLADPAKGFNCIGFDGATID